MKISKKNLDELLRLEREYTRTGDWDILETLKKTARVLSVEAFGNEEKWCAFSSLSQTLCGIYPLKNGGCSNKEAYAILEMLGYEVEVVRCKDCKHSELSINAIGEPCLRCNNADIGFYEWLSGEDDFWDDTCSYGERREGE